MERGWMRRAQRASEDGSPELVLGPIVGYRLWWIGPDGVLRSLNRAVEAVYPPRGEVRARCDRGHADPPPGAACVCGIYAWKRLPDPRSEERPGGPRLPEISMECIYVGPRWAEAAGLVRLWGRVVEHEEGYRAERASVAAIVSFDEVINVGNVLSYYAPAPGWYRRRLREIANRYEVPLLGAAAAADAMRTWNGEEQVTPGSNGKEESCAT